MNSKVLKNENYIYVEVQIEKTSGPRLGDDICQRDYVHSKTDDV